MTTILTSLLETKHNTQHFMSMVLNHTMLNENSTSESAVANQQVNIPSDEFGSKRCSCGCDELQVISYRTSSCVACGKWWDLYTSLSDYEAFT